MFPLFFLLFLIKYSPKYKKEAAVSFIFYIKTGGKRHAAMSLKQAGARFRYMTACFNTGLRELPRHAYEGICFAPCPYLKRLFQHRS